MPRYRQTYTLFKRGKFFYYRTYTAEGVRTTAHSTGCTSLTAARVYCDRLFLEGKMFAGSGMTFRNYAAGFFDKDSVYAKDNGLSPRSIAIYSTAAATITPTSPRTYYQFIFTTNSKIKAITSMINADDNFWVKHSPQVIIIGNPKYRMKYFNEELSSS